MGNVVRESSGLDELPAHTLAKKAVDKEATVVDSVNKIVQAAV